jgi:hypothetical protein
MSDDLRRFIRDQFEWGDFTAIGQLTDRSPNTVAKHYDPTADTPCAIVKADAELAQIGAVNPSGAVRIAKMILARAQLRAGGHTARCADSAIGSATSESVDVVKSRLEGKPLQEQKREAYESISAWFEVLAALEAEEARGAKPGRAREAAKV